MEEQNDGVQASPEQASRQASNSGSDNSDRQMFKAKCSDCGSDCEVPFEPKEGKPVRCSDCFRKNRPQRNFNGGGRDGGRGNFNRSPAQMHDAKCTDCGKDCQVPFKPKEGSPVRCRDCYSKTKSS